MSSEAAMLATIVAKSDQLNAEDLIGGPITVTITAVKVQDRASADVQPVSVSYEGDGGKPYKPCKSMRRVMVRAWGADANRYVGQSMTLYRDDKVTFGKDEVGGIRISHMSGIDEPKTWALTASKAQRKPYTVHPLRQARPRQEAPRRSQEPAGGGFGAPPADDEALSAAKQWARQVQEDLEGDVWRTVAAIDAFTRDADAVAQFQALAAEDEAHAKRLEAALIGRRKALATRGG